VVVVVRIIPAHTASRREQRDTRAVIIVEAGLTLATLLYGMAGHPASYDLAAVFGLLTLWMLAMHLLGPRG